MDPYLTITTEGGRRVVLAGKQAWTVGRGRANDIAIDDQWISRQHAMLQLMDGGEVYLVDFGSQNGSFVNDRRVSTPVPLKDGDRLTLGGARFEFHAPARPAAPAAAPGAGRQQPADVTSMTVPLRERRLISVLVVDVRDFTVLSRQLGEARLSEVIGVFFRRTGDVIRHHGSWVDKYIGDALMAVWFHDGNAGQDAQASSLPAGAAGPGPAGTGPAFQPDPQVVRLFRAVGEIHRVVLALNAEFPLPFPLRIGAGVNTGWAMVGNTGSRDRADYTALGDTVNAAFRLESATKDVKADVVIGRDTHHRLAGPAGAPTPFARRLVKLKGYDEMTEAYTASFADVETFLYDARLNRTTIDDTDSRPARGA